MASDLSTIIQEGLCSTLNGLLAKDAVLKKTTKIHEKDLEGIQTLKIDTTFEFDNITSTWSFIIPAYTASYIFNCMIADESEPVLQIDDDIADAINEFISTVSGGLTTTINGAGYEDLTNSKFTISGSQILESGEVEELEHIYKFLINLDDINIDIFILFDNVILPFIEDLKQSPVTAYVEAPQANTEEPPSEEKTNEVDISEIENLDIETPQNVENTQQLQKEESFLEQNENKTDNIDVSNNKDTKIENKSSEVEEKKELSPKEKKLKIIIIAVASLLALTIIAALVIYFMGVFDEPETIVDNNETNKTTQSKNIISTKNKVNFDITQINKKRLNAKLEALTKYEILDYLEIEAQKKAEKERLAILNKEESLKKFAAKNKEETLVEEELIKDKELETTKETQSKLTDTNLKFILVHSLKYKLYKQMILQTKTKNARISICKNQDGRTAVYIGPFKDITSQEKVFELIKQQAQVDATLESLTTEEFNIRCNFE